MQLCNGPDLDAADVIVVGSGGSALTAALAAAESGASVVVLEKASTLGGTTALSGGMLWMPGNGLDGAPEPEADRGAASGYLDAVTLGRADKELLDAHLERVPEFLEFIRDVGGVDFQLIGSFPDYESQLEGSSHGGGRSLEPQLYDLKQLGEKSRYVRKDPRLPFRQVEYFEGWKTMRNMPVEELKQRDRDEIAARGRALVGPLIKALLDRDVTIHVEAAVERLVIDDGAVTGVVVGGRELTARRGVVLGAGGFEWNDELVRRFLSGPIEARCSNPLNVGDGHKMAMAAGVGLSGMSEAWWGVMAKIPGLEIEGQEVASMMAVERGLPGTVIVNRFGQRFVDETISYYSIGKVFATFEPRSFQYKNLPAYMVGDARFFQHYGIMGQDDIDAVPDWIVKADTLAELAGKIGVDVEGLERTVTEFNAHAKDGVDPEFGRGEIEYGNYFGDPTLEGNPNIAPLEQGPYVALRLYCGAIGTKGGVQTAVDGQALSSFGERIPGLFAVGNNAAHPIAFGYPGAGGTLGPAMTAALAAGRSVAAAPATVPV